MTALSHPAAAADTWYVDATGGSDANDCMSAATACLTIQAAINKAANGDTINVADGPYLEPAPGPLTVNKTLNLLGAQDGVDARSRVAAESIVTDPQGTIVTASNVVVDGFTFQDSISLAFTGYGLLLGAGTTGTQVLNNIIQNNIIGIGLANTGAIQVLIRHNLIQNNNRLGPSTGTGIYTDQFVCGAGCSNFLVDENAFRGNADAGIFISNTDQPNPLTRLDVSQNLFDGNGRAVGLINTDMSTIHENSITNNTLVASGAIRIFDSVDGLTILSNDLMGGVGHAIRMSSSFGLGPSSNIEIHQNNIEVFALTGLTVGPLSHVGTVNAECNWWNSPSGPFNVPDNPGGTGEEVVGDADFTPWLTARAPGGPCIGGVPSTPGKVTGGGHIEGEPVFDGGGLLLSLPALVLSASSPNEKATFGFVAKCCPEAGNLSYHDHAADVRIKAISIDFLEISSPTTACPSTPGGGMHALFTGRAKVTDSSGTTTEQSLTVNVDDCGEPGTMDTLHIKTDSYENGPKTLTGGNIQIHK